MGLEPLVGDSSHNVPLEINGEEKYITIDENTNKIKVSITTGEIQEMTKRVATVQNDSDQTIYDTEIVKQWGDAKDRWDLEIHVKEIKLSAFIDRDNVGFGENFTSFRLSLDG